MAIVNTQVLPQQGEVYGLTKYPASEPSGNQYSTALDPANKDAVSVNDSLYKANSGNAFVDLKNPIVLTKESIIKEPINNLVPILIIGLSIYFLTRKTRS